METGLLKSTILMMVLGGVFSIQNGMAGEKADKIANLLNETGEFVNDHKTACDLTAFGIGSFSLGVQSTKGAIASSVANEHIIGRKNGIFSKADSHNSMVKNAQNVLNEADASLKTLHPDVQRKLALEGEKKILKEQLEGLKKNASLAEPQSAKLLIESTRAVAAQDGKRAAVKRLQDSIDGIDRELTELSKSEAVKAYAQTEVRISRAQSTIDLSKKSADYELSNAALLEEHNTLAKLKAQHAAVTKQLKANADDVLLVKREAFLKGEIQSAEQAIAANEAKLGKGFKFLKNCSKPLLGAVAGYFSYRAVIEGKKAMNEADLSISTDEAKSDVEHKGPSFGGDKKGGSESAR